MTLTWLGTVGDNRHIDVMLTGRLGRLGSTPGLFVGIGFGSCAIFSFTRTHTLGGKLSSCGQLVSNKPNLSCTWTVYSHLEPECISLDIAISCACCGVKWNTYTFS